MDDNKMEFGDDKFRDYLNKLNNPEEEDTLDQILTALKSETDFIANMYKKSIDGYKSLETNDPLKEKIYNFILQLIDHSTHTINQFDYIHMSIQDNNEEDDTEGN